MKKGWQTKKLGDVCVFDKEQGVHRGLPYVGLEHIESHTARFIGSSEPRPVKSSTFRFSHKHVLYGRLRPYLNKALAPDFEGHCSTEIFPLKPRPELSREYLLYWLLADETCGRINASCTGARMPRAQMNEVLNFEFPLPPPAEQLWIVGLLDEAFASIVTAKANAEKNLQDARALFESHLQSVFTQRGPGWVQMRLSELCDIKHGYAFEGEFFSNEGEYVLLTPGNFYERGGYRDRGEKQKYYTGEIPRDYVLNEGDLLVAMTEQAAGLLGSPIIVPKSDKFLHNQRLGLVTKKPGASWVNEFFFHVFNTQPVRKAIHDSASGVKVRHTSPTKIGDVAIVFPTALEEQKRIVSTLAALDEETQRLGTLYERKLAALDALKKSLLHEAFSGNLTKSESISEAVLTPRVQPISIPNITPIDLHAGILAMACDTHRKHNRLTEFTHVKAEKIAHMVETRLGINLGREPVKDAAGPNDFPHLKKVEFRAQKANYFDFKQVAGGAYRVETLRGFEQLIERTRGALGEHLAAVEKLLHWMLPMTVRQAEIVATVFAGWNNLLLDGKKPTDEEIVVESRENWHRDKLNIEREKFFAAIEWLRKQGIVPDGRGKRVNAKHG